MVEIFQHARDLTRSKEALWPGFARKPFGIIVYRPGLDALMLTPDGFAQAPPRWVSQSKGIFSHCGGLEGLNGNFDTSYMVAEQEFVAVKLESTRDKTLDVLFHEAFHKFQSAAFAPTTSAADIELHVEPYLDTNEIGTPAFIAGLELERRILARLVGSSDVAERRALAHMYLAAREERLANASPTVVSAELNIARKEGSAAYVGAAAVRQARREPFVEPSEQMKMFAAEPPVSTPFGSTPYPWFRARAFGNAALIAFELARSGTDWKMGIHKGATFDEILARQTDYDAGQADSLSGRARARFSYADLLAQAEAWRKSFTELSRDDFIGAARYPLYLTFPRAGVSFPEFVGTGTGIPSQPEENVVIFMQATTLSVQYGSIDLSAGNTAYMLDLREAPDKFTVVLSLTEPPASILSPDGGSRIVSSKGLKLAVPATSAISMNPETGETRVSVPGE